MAETAHTLLAAALGAAITLLIVLYRRLRKLERNRAIRIERDLLQQTLDRANDALPPPDRRSHGLGVYNGGLCAAIAVGAAAVRHLRQTHTPALIATAAVVVGATAYVTPSPPDVTEPSISGTGVSVPAHTPTAPPQPARTPHARPSTLPQAPRTTRPPATTTPPQTPTAATQAPSVPPASTTPTVPLNSPVAAVPRPRIRDHQPIRRIIGRERQPTCTSTCTAESEDGGDGRWRQELEERWGQRLERWEGARRNWR